MAAVLRPEQIETISSVAEQLEAKGLLSESHRLRVLLEQFENEPQEMSASAAAQILEVTPQTVRNWVRAGILPGRQDKTGRFHVLAKALRHAIEMRALLPDAPQVAISGEEIDALIDEVRAERRAQAATRR